MAQAGPETWTVEGTRYPIASTYYLALPEGLQYTIDYEAPATLDLAQLTDARAFEAVAFLMRHAASARLYERQVIRDASGNIVPVKMIGVSIFSKSGILTGGYRVSRPLEQLLAPGR